MATIDDLSNVSVSDMSGDELFARLREIRLSRRTPKRKKGASKKVVKKELSLNEQLNMLSPEQAASILNKLTAE